MNALDFLDFILEKHHEGMLEEPKEKDPTWEPKEKFISTGNGFERVEDIDK